MGNDDAAGVERTATSAPRVGKAAEPGQPSHAKHEHHESLKRQHTSSGGFRLHERAHDEGPGLPFNALEVPLGSQQAAPQEPPAAALLGFQRPRGPPGHRRLCRNLFETDWNSFETYSKLIGTYSKLIGTLSKLIGTYSKLIGTYWKLIGTYWNLSKVIGTCNEPPQARVSSKIWRWWECAGVWYVYTYGGCAARRGAARRCDE